MEKQRGINIVNKDKPKQCDIHVVSSALGIVRPIAELYTPKQDAYWFEYIDKDGYTKAFDKDQETYCEDCSFSRKEEILKGEKIIHALIMRF